MSAPLAVMVEGPPLHTRVLFGIAVNVGFGCTITIWLAIDVQPKELSPVTLYEVGIPGASVNDCATVVVAEDVDVQV